MLNFIYMHSDLSDKNWLSLFFDYDLILPVDKNNFPNSPLKENNKIYSYEADKPDVSFENLSDDLVFFGENKSKIFIIVYYAEHEWIKTKDQIFLNNILQAIKSSIDQSALINIAKSGHKHIKEIISKLPDYLVFVFGIPNELYSGFNTNSVEKYNQTKIIISPVNLTDLAMDGNQKKILWKNMKETYKL